MPPGTSAARLIAAGSEERGGARRAAGRLSAWRRKARIRLARDHGFTLIELLIAAAIAITVFSATLAMLESSQTVQSRDSEWALTMQEGRTGLARMVREIRQASAAPEEAKAGTILFKATIGGKKLKIKYECGVSQSGTKYTECVRLAAEEPKALPGTGPAIVKDVLNGTKVFSYSPNTTKPTLTTVTVELPAKGTLNLASSPGYSHDVVLEDAAFMRNLEPNG